MADNNSESSLRTRKQDKRLAPGALVVVDDDPLPGRAVQRLAQSLGGGYEVHRARSIEELRQVVIPRRRRTANRIRVRGFYIDWFLDRCRAVTALDALAWLDETYPRTPVVLLTGSDDTGAIERDCQNRGLHFLRKEDVPGDWVLGSGRLRDALLGVVLVCSRPVPLVWRFALPVELMRYCERVFFGLWDARCIEIRRWLLDAAGVNAIEVDEQHLRTLDAYFESVPECELHRARGVLPPTMAQIVSEIRALFGVADLDVLKHRWEREQGRGATLALSSWRPPHPDRPRPSARRVR